MIDIIRDSFAFLRKEYGFSIIKCETDKWSTLVMYVNEDRDLALSVTFEPREAYLFVIFHRLKDGAFQRNREPITAETLHEFDLGFLVPDEQRMKPTYAPGQDSKYFAKRNGFKLYIREYAHQLKQYGRSILLGDFSEFSVVAERMRDDSQRYSENKDGHS